MGIFLSTKLNLHIGTLWIELELFFLLIPGNYNMHEQKSAVAGLCAKPYLHGSINPGTLKINVYKLFHANIW
jgi:hypothetical protein